MWFLVEDDGDFEKTHASWPLDDFFYEIYTGWFLEEETSWLVLFAAFVQAISR